LTNVAQTIRQQGGSLLPTPLTSDAKVTAPGDMRRESVQLRAVGSLLPTPEARLGSAGPDFGRASRPQSGGDDLQTTVQKKLLPTPTCGNATETDVANQMETRKSPGLESVAGLLDLPEETWNRTDPSRFREDSLAARKRAAKVLPTPVAQHSGNTPEDHLRKKPGRQVVTDLAILTENGLLASGGRISPDGGAVQESLLDLVPEPVSREPVMPTPTTLDNVEKRTTHAGGGLTLQGVVGGVNPVDAERLGRSGVEVQEWKAIASGTVWGEYEPVIRRWEQIMGTPAPSPTEITSKGTHRLSARFTEWMMGQPAGWITDPSIGISRNEQLKACGNGVVTQQAVAALSVMLARSDAA
jgi:hypothetical protein